MDNSGFLPTEVQDVVEDNGSCANLRIDFDLILDDRPKEQEISQDGSDPQRAYKTMPDGLVLRPSWIPEEDQGVWTTVAFPKGTRFGPYEGDIAQDLSEIKNTRHCWEIYDNDKVSHFIDASDESRSNWMRFINFARNRDQQNVASHQEHGQIFYTTTHDITADTELLVWYKDSDSNNNMEFENEENAQEFQVDIKDGLLDSVQKENAPKKNKLCSYCGKVFQQTGTLNLHLKIHTGEKPHKCPFCPSAFTQRCNLERHLFVHLKSDTLKKHKCDKCNKMFHREDNMLTHQRQHDKFSYMCSICNKTYERRGNIRRHIFERHMKNEPITDISGLGNYHICETCGKTYTSKKAFMAHQEKHGHIVGKNPEEEKKIEPMMGTLIEPIAPSKLEIGENDMIYDFEIPMISDNFIQDLLLERPSENADAEGIKNGIKTDTVEIEKPTKKLKVAEDIKEYRKKNSGKTRVRKNTKESKKPIKRKEKIKEEAVKKDCGPFWISCSVCGRVFGEKDQLILHSKTHTSRAAMCFMCGKH